ncbi:MAG TPA: hypothetical protein PK961_11915 [bacterium]|nr:hypothetical protein [bacterium]
MLIKRLLALVFGLFFCGIVVGGCGCEDVSEPGDPTFCILPDAGDDDDDDAADDDSDDDTADDDSDDDTDDDDTDDDDDDQADVAYVDGGGFSGAALALSPAGDIQVVSVKAREMRVYSADEWNYEVAVFDVLANPAAALDDDGRLHLSYYDWYGNRLLYAVQTERGWDSQVVDEDGDVGHYSAIAVDGDGHVHIAYNKEVSRASIGVRYATDAGGAWSAENVDSGQDVGSFPALALDDDGAPCLTYNGADEIFLACLDDKGWTSQALPDSYANQRDSGLAFDGDGDLHIVYLSTDAPDKLRHAYGLPGSLVDESIAGTPNVGDTLAMAVDADDVVHFTYYNYSLVGVMYGNNAAKDWTAANIGSGTPVFVAANAVDDVVISLGGLGVFRQTGGGWSQQYFDRGFTVEDVALAADGSGNLHAVYFDSTFQALTYARQSGSEWTTEVIEEALGNNVENVDLVLDGDDKAHITFYNGLTTHLGYATNVSGSWVLSDIDDADFVGRDNSLAIDGNGDLHVSYSDDAHGSLMYATDVGGAWAHYTVDDQGLVGSESNIAVNGDGDAVIAYVDLSDYDINLAVGGEDDWTIETVDRDGGNDVSLAIDGDGKPHVAYVGAGLRHAVKDGSWTIDSVDSLALEMETDIVVRDDGRVFIAYQSLDWNLSLAQAGGSWSTSILDEIGDTGEHVSMLLTSGGDWNIAYVSYGAVWLATPR